MNLSSLTVRVKALVMAIGMTLIACATAPSAFAAGNAVDAKSTAKGMADVPALIAGAGIACDLNTAYFVGQTGFMVDGKQVKGQTYEISCKNAAPGLIITSTAPGKVDKAYNCTIGASFDKKEDVTRCVLPENAPHYAWLNTVVKPFVPDCVVSDARLIGSVSTEPKFDRFEFACKTGPGGIIDYASLGSSKVTDYRSCLALEGSNSACKFTTHDQMIAPLKPLVTKANSNCVVSDIRYAATAANNAGSYYEVGCGKSAGFLILVGPGNTYVSSASCAQAGSIGGCKFTDAATAAADVNTGYASALKTGGYACTVKDINVLGTETHSKRDYVEFKCPEQPWGLIGLIPQPDSTALLNVHDCFIESGHKNPMCTLTTKADLVKQIDKLIKIKEPTKGCDVKDVRFIGESDSTEGAEIVEIACVNKRGYIAVIAKDRNSLLVSDPCRLAASHGDAQKCTIPENGTYAD